MVLSNLLFCGTCGLEMRLLLHTGSGNRLRNRFGFAIKEPWVKRLNSIWVALVSNDKASGIQIFVSSGLRSPTVFYMGSCTRSILMNTHPFDPDPTPGTCGNEERTSMACQPRLFRFQSARPSLHVWEVAECTASTNGQRQTIDIP